MRKPIIPWQVYRDAIETLNPHSLNLWLQRWQYMDAGVTLFDRSISALELPPTIFNLLRDQGVMDDCQNANQMMQSPKPAPISAKRIIR